MERISYRQFTTWLEWLRQQWNKPTRADHYAAQVAQEVYNANHRKGRTLDKFFLKFKFTKKQPKPELSPEDKLAQSKAGWFGALGMKRKKQ